MPFGPAENEKPSTVRYGWLVWGCTTGGNLAHRILFPHHGEGGRTSPVLGLHDLVASELDAVSEGLDVFLRELGPFHLRASASVHVVVAVQAQAEIKTIMPQQVWLQTLASLRMVE